MMMTDRPTPEEHARYMATGMHECASDCPTADRPATEPRTPTGRSIIGQDYRGNEVYTITREGVLAIEAEAAPGAAPETPEDRMRRLNREWSEGAAPLDEWSGYKPDAEEEVWMNAPMGAAPRAEGPPHDAGRLDRNHYDRFTALEAANLLSDEGLVEAHRKFSEALTDPFVHDAAKIVVELVEEIQRYRAAPRAEAVIRPSDERVPEPHCTCQRTPGMFPHKDFCWWVKAGLVEEGSMARRPSDERVPEERNDP